MAHQAEQEEKRAEESAREVCVALYMYLASIQGIRRILCESHCNA